MTTRLATFPLMLDGGVDTERGPSAGFPLRNDGGVAVPYLIEGQNCIYNLDGWPQKMPGASNVNGTATGATDIVMGLFDYWRSTASGSPVQQRIVYSGTQIYSETVGTLT